MRDPLPLIVFGLMVYAALLIIQHLVGLDTWAVQAACDDTTPLGRCARRVDIQRLSATAVVVAILFVALRLLSKSK